MTTRLNPSNGLPPAQGLYDPAHEHDACGIGFVASIRGEKSHDIIRKGIRGAAQPDPSRRVRAAIRRPATAPAF